MDMVLLETFKSFHDSENPDAGYDVRFFYYGYRAWPESYTYLLPEQRLEDY